MKMPIPDAAISALMGYVVVFVGLVLLMAVIVLLGKAMNAKVSSPKAAAPKAATATPAGGTNVAAPVVRKLDGPFAPGTAGEVKLYDVSDRDAAMIMAIVADTMGVPLNELRFKSIKEVK